MSGRNLIQKLKHTCNLSLQNDVLKCIKKYKSQDNMFNNLENYLWMEYIVFWIDDVRMCL